MKKIYVKLEWKCDHFMKYFCTSRSVKSCFQFIEWLNHECDVQIIVWNIKTHWTKEKLFINNSSFLDFDFLCKWLICILPSELRNVHLKYPLNILSTCIILCAWVGTKLDDWGGVLHYNIQVYTPITLNYIVVWLFKRVKCWSH